MAKFVSKPVEVEAVQFNCIAKLYAQEGFEYDVKPGDWMITNPDGSVVVMGDAQFKATYRECIEPPVMVSAEAYDDFLEARKERDRKWRDEDRAREQARRNQDLLRSQGEWLVRPYRPQSPIIPTQPDPNSITVTCDTQFTSTTPNAYSGYAPEPHPKHSIPSPFRVKQPESETR